MDQGRACLMERLPSFVILCSIFIANDLFQRCSLGVLNYQKSYNKL